MEPNSPARVWLLHNPAAGSAGISESELRKALEEAGLAVDTAWDVTRRSGAPELGADHLVVVAGGDGTVSSFIAPCLDTGAALAVLPCGTANDFARSLGMPLEPIAAAAALREAEVRPVDLARLDGQYFLNVAHVGLGANISHALDEREKSRWKRLSYLKTLIGHLRGSDAFRGTIECDDRTLRGRWLEIAIANAPSFGGGATAPCEVAMDDGMLDVIGARARPIPLLMAAALRTKLRGPGADRRMVCVRTRRVRVTASKPVPVTADGESRGVTPVTATSLPGRLRVLAPRPRPA